MPITNNTLGPDGRRQKEKDWEGGRDGEIEREHGWCTSVMHYCCECQRCYPGFRNYVRRGLIGSSLNHNLSSPPLRCSVLVTISTHFPLFHTKNIVSFSNVGCFLSVSLTHTLLNTPTHTTHYPPVNSSGRSQPPSFLWTQLFLNKVLMVLTSSSNKPFPPIREDCGAGAQSRPVGITEETSWFSLITPSLSVSLSLCVSPLSAPAPSLPLQISLSQWLLALPSSLTQSRTFLSCLCLSTHCIFCLVSSASIPLIAPRFAVQSFQSLDDELVIHFVSRNSTNPFNQEFKETFGV